MRSALGATGRRLMRDIAVRGLLLGAAGCALGLPLAIAVSRVLTARLYGVGALDPATHGGAVALVLMLAVMASLAPALRVLRVSPLSALRGE